MSASRPQNASAENHLQLPAPDAGSQAHSEKLIALITDEIAAAIGRLNDFKVFTNDQATKANTTSVISA